MDIILDLIAVFALGMALAWIAHAIGFRFRRWHTGTQRWARKER